MGSNQPPNAPIGLSGSDSAVIRDEPVEPASSSYLRMLVVQSM